MADKMNIEEHINENLLWGVEQLIMLISLVLGKSILDKDYNIDECLQLKMPTWFIKEYNGVSDKTITRAAKRLHLRRNKRNFTKLTNYRLLKH